MPSPDAITTAPPAAPPASPRRPWFKRPVPLLVLAAGLALAAWFGVPMAVTAFTTVSTDDAYVNGHVTYVAARVAGQVKKVHIDDNDFVDQGQVLVELDPEPFDLDVATKKAALDVAEAALNEARAQVRGDESNALAAWFKVELAMDRVKSQTAVLQANVANLKRQLAALDDAERDYRRASMLAPQAAISAEELDLSRRKYLEADALVQSARSAIRDTRSALGLPLEPTAGKPLDDAPRDLDQKFSGVQSALSDFVQAMARLGARLPLTDITPKGIQAHLRTLSTAGDLKTVMNELIEKAPATRLAKAKRDRARSDLDQAELNRRYTTVRAEIRGFVSQRNVNPGNYAQAGQRLMAVRSFDEVWIDANFKETQLSGIRIGMPVDLYVDAYGGKVFRGRVSGFSAGTGASLALLPPENATGNFVKIVQRLPVRVDLVDGNSREAPLFIGLSVTPYVRIREEPTGPNAGQFLRGPVRK